MDRVLAFYKFVPLADLQGLKSLLKAKAIDLNLKGTILIAPEGINGSLAGTQAETEEFLTFLKSDSRFSDLEIKESFFDETSFRRMLVKIKKEIITMGKSNIDPIKDTGKFLSAATFQQWMEEGKELLLLDTRNDYEVQLGTFKGAINPNIQTFSQFPDWIDKNLSTDDKDKTIVTFCTGGIRCEKATAYMQQQGFNNVYQIQGGILKYFSEVCLKGQPSYWQGDCVVFDKRKALKSTLEATEDEICFVCLCKIDGTSKAENLYPAGRCCKKCDSSMQSHHLKRKERGLLLQKHNDAIRAGHRKQKRLEYAKSATVQ